MLKKLSLAALIFFTVWFTNSACKKSSTTTGGGGNGNTTNPNITPTNATDFYAFLSYTKDQNINLGSSTIYTGYQANAVFDSLPMPINFNNWPLITVDSVFFNNVICPLDTSSKNYNCFQPDSICYWRVVGNSKVHSFSFTKNNGMAVYTNYNLLPDTIDHTHPITFPINVTNADDLVVILNMNGTGPIDTLAHCSTSATFSVAQMSVGHTGLGSILVQNSKYYNYNVFGKPMQFAFFYYFEKQVYFK